MNISIFNSHNSLGGAAKAANRLCLGLKQLNSAQVKYLVKDIDLDAQKNDYTFQIPPPKQSTEVIDKLLQINYIRHNRTEISNTLFSISYAGTDLSLTPLEHSDIINLHWIEKFFNNNSLQQIVELQKPIVWTLHDMKPFTGGCHYNAGCREFEHECSNCSQLNYDPFKLAYKVLKQKINILEDANLTIVTPSKWLAEEAKKSTLFKNKRIEVIPNSIETDIYSPIDKKKAKEFFQIDTDKIVLQFGAQDTREKRKGFDYLLKAINLALENKDFKRLCDDEKILILCLGYPSEELTNLPIEFKILGYLSDDSTIAMAYNATDIYILPTLEDNLPNSIIESLACKTSIISFDTGGVSDIVKDDENGLLVTKGDVKALSNAIIELTFDPEKRKLLGENGRKLIESNFKLEDQAKKYMSLFEELTNNSTKKKKCKYIHNELFDDVIGYSIRKEIEKNPHFLQHKPNQPVSDNSFKFKLKKYLHAFTTKHK